MLEIQKINETFLQNQYLGTYEGKGSEKERIEQLLDEIDSQNSDIRPAEVLKNLRLQYVNYYYGISKEQWEKIKNEKQSYKKHLLVYDLFSKRYSYTFSTYIRNFFIY